MAEYKLLKPIQKVDGSKIEVVEIKEDFDGNDIEKIGNTVGDGTILNTIVACAINQSLTVVRNMSGRDIKKIAEIAKGFLDDGENPA